MTYEFKEYPKWIVKPDGTKIIVQSAEEEQSILGNPNKEPNKPSTKDPKKATAWAQ